MINALQCIMRVLFLDFFPFMDGTLTNTMVSTLTKVKQVLMGTSNFYANFGTDKQSICFTTSMS